MIGLQRRPDIPPPTPPMGGQRNIDFCSIALHSFGGLPPKLCGVAKLQKTKKDLIQNAYKGKRKIRVDFFLLNSK